MTEERRHIISCPKIMNATDNYRYPGSRPFQDTDLDRRLFFGRDEEKQALLHLVLAENLVVLFAKSGMGKTSLLNAGLLQPLRERNFIPFKIRFNDSEIIPLQAVYQGIEDTVQQYQIEYNPGEKDILWQYFKIVEFWSAEDTLLTPVLILDQFEEFFNLHLPEERNSFITQVADLVKGRIPRDLREGIQSGENFTYSEISPSIKLIISIREDYLGELEEMSREIPDILQNRFRLTALTRDQAAQAIVEPAQLEDKGIRTESFYYASETVETMLDFLCKQRKRNEISLTDEVEPFQLQLLCQHIENTVREKAEKTEAKVTIQKDELGGETGMQRVLEDFYEDQIHRLSLESERRNVRNLCEQGLISASDRRLSLEEEEIERQFSISKSLLAELVDSRLLRAEPRVGSVYYELSHDTLIEPIRNAQKRHQGRRNRINQEIQELNKEARQLTAEGKIEDAVAKYKQIIELDNTFVWAYLRLGGLFVEQRKLEKAVGTFNEAIHNEIHHAVIYHHLGRVLKRQGEEAVKKEQEAVIIDSQVSIGPTSSGDIDTRYKKFDEAIKNYEIALSVNTRNRDAYKELALLYIKLDQPEKASHVYQQAIQVEPEYAYLYTDLVKALEEKKMKEQVESMYEIASMVDSEDASYYNELGRQFHAREKYDKAIDSYTKAIQLDPNYVGAYTNLGFTFHRLGKHEKTIEYCKKAIQLDPKFAPAYHWTANALTSQGKYDKAMKYHQKAIEFAPNFAYAYNGLGFTFTRQSNYDKAIENYQKAIQLEPKFTFAYANLGWAFNSQSKYDQAMQSFQKAIQLDPNLFYGYTGLGQALRMQGKYDEAIENYQKAIEIAPHLAGGYSGLGQTFGMQGKYDEAIKYCQKAIQLEPHNAHAYSAMGWMFFNKRDYEEAGKYHQQAIRLASHFAYMWDGLGAALLQQGKYDETMRACQRAIELAPNYASAYQHIGSALNNLGKYEKALEYCQKAIQLEPHNAHAYSALGWVFFSKRDYEEAGKYHRQAIRLASHFAYMWDGLGLALLLQGKYDETIEACQRAIELAPDHASAYQHIADALRSQGKYDKALEYCQKAIQLNPNSAYVYTTLGSILMSHGRYDEAIVNYKKTIELLPNFAIVYIRLGLAFTAQEKYDEAIENHQKALELQSDNPFPYFGLGLTLLRQGKYGEAVEKFQEALHIDSKFAGAYNGLFEVYFEYWHEYPKAYEMCAKAYNLNSENIIARINFAIGNLIIGNFEKALTLADEVLGEQDISLAPKLAMQFIAIASLLIQIKRTEALARLEKFIEYYTFLPQNFRGFPESKGCKDFIDTMEKLSESDKTLLLTLIDILESPKPKADEKLAELEASLAEMFTEKEK